MQNELCKCFVHEIIKEMVFISYKRAKIDEIHLALCDGKPCIIETGIMDMTTELEFHTN